MLADAEDVALSFEQTNPNQPIQTDRVRHPIALLFHLGFRSIAIVLYLFSTLFLENFITIFVVTIMFLSMDFWTVKNITGRLLVGLRWWNYVDENGKSHWIFESRKNNAANNQMSQIIVESTTETRLFWLGLIASQLLWTFFFVISIFTFKFKWLTIIVVAFLLNGSNLYGFMKCKFGTQQNISSFATSFFRKQMFKTLIDRVSKQNTTDQSQTNTATTTTTDSATMPK